MWTEYRGDASVLKMQHCLEFSTQKNKWGGAGQKHRLHLFPRSELFGVIIIEEKRYLFVSDVHLCLLCYPGKEVQSMFLPCPSPLIFLCGKFKAMLHF
jgi:hypothetical protein